jgi:hypothetical protein
MPYRKKKKAYAKKSPPKHTTVVKTRVVKVPGRTRTRKVMDYTAAALIGGAAVVGFIMAKNSGYITIDPTKKII